MERRRARRYVRRLRVQLEVPPPGPPVGGTTVNLSVSGALIRSTRMLPQGTRVRAILQEQAHGAVFEAKVVRHVKARSMEDEALAIRFLLPSELLTELVPQVAWGAAARDASPARPAVAPVAEDEVEPEARSGPRIWAVPEVEPEATTVNQGDDGPMWFEPGLSPFDSKTGAVVSEAASGPVLEPAAEPVPEHDYRILIGDAAALQRRYEDELRYGGLFVHASSPPVRDQRVVVKIDLPWAGLPGILVKGRVVHQVPSPPAQAGFALEFDDREGLLQELKPLLPAR